MSAKWWQIYTYIQIYFNNIELIDHQCNNANYVQCIQIINTAILMLFKSLLIRGLVLDGVVEPLSVFLHNLCTFDPWSCINSFSLSDVCMRQWIGSALVQIMAWRHWTLSNKRQWNFIQNTKCFIHENASEKIVCEMAVMFSRGRWVKFTAP